MKPLSPPEGRDQPVAPVKDAVGARPTLRFLTCGSVDDGKSTLIGRLLYETKFISDDELRAVKRDSARYGTVDGDIDFAQLLHGLEADHEQGITIDVAYRHFSTAARSFMVADPPGHERYTRSMVTSASKADLAIVLVDARKGLLAQTFRHSIIVSLLGIRHLVLAINKFDLVDFRQSIFEDLMRKFQAFSATLGFQTRQAIPISARHGDNVSSNSERMPWYGGPNLLAHLETINVEHDLDEKPFRMAVQLVAGPDPDFRGFAGSIASGRVKPGDDIIIASSGTMAKVERILTAGGDRPAAQAGEAVTLCLTPHTDIARGDLLASAEHRPHFADQIAAHLIWMSDESLLPGRSYLMKIGTRTVPAAVSEIKHRLDINTVAKLAAKTLGLNEIGFCNLTTASPISFDPYGENRDTGSFILIDRFTNTTVAAGLIEFGLRRATNIHYQGLAISKQARALLKHQRPAILWFTGLSGAGKSTIANLIDARLHARGIHTLMLDGDNMRHGLNKDLGFTEADRVENIRRVGEVAKLMVEAGLIVLCSLISPFRAERRMVRELVEADEFIEVFVDTPLEQCIARDPKGLYRRAMAGEIPNFTGISQPYEQPDNAEIIFARVRRRRTPSPARSSWSWCAGAFATASQVQPELPQKPSDQSGFGRSVRGVECTRTPSSRKNASHFDVSVAGNWLPVIARRHAD